MIELEEPLESAYFNWLCAQVMKIETPTPSLTYWKLLLELQNTEFVWLVSMDDNRSEDGKELRIEFMRQIGMEIDHEWLNIGCSVLEMLIAFSRRASFTTGRSSEDWFWVFLDNLGLSEFNDASYLHFPVSDIVDRFIWRTYEFDGTGGLFPILHTPRDQRKIEVWYQFSEYIMADE